MTKPTGCSCLFTNDRWIHDPTCTVHANQPTEEQRVLVLICADPTNDTERGNGHFYQRCGGGRRVIRKRIGGN